MSVASLDVMSCPGGLLMQCLESVPQVYLSLSSSLVSCALSLSAGL